MIHRLLRTPSAWLAGAITTALLAAAPAAQAEEWAIHGGRARGMGGAGMGLERDQFWNPAGIALPIPVKRKDAGGAPLSSGRAQIGTGFKTMEVQVGVDGQFEIVTLGDIIQELDDIADIYFNTDFAAVQARLNAGSATAQDIQTALQLVEQIQDLEAEGQGLYGTVVGNGEAHVHTPRLSVGVFGRVVGYAGANPEVNWNAIGNSAIADGGFGDTFGSIGTFNSPATTAGSNLATSLTNNVTGISAAEANELAFQAEQAGLNLDDPDTIQALIKVAQATVDSGVGGLDASASLFFNQSGVRLRGIRIEEGGVTIGRSFDLGVVQFALGVSVKLMEATTNDNLIAVSRLTDGEQALDKLLDDWNRNEESLTTWGIDAGAMAILPGGFTVGIAGRNLNRPVFASHTPQSYYLTPQARAGVAWQPIDWVTFAFDADLWTTGTRVTDRYHTQLMGGGVEFDAGKKSVHLFLRLGAYRNVAEPDEAVTYTAGVGMHMGPIKIDAAVAASLDQAAVENANDALDTQEDATWWNFEELYPERFGATVTINVSVQF